MSGLVARKFPELEWQGRRLVWDSRQAASGRAERVYVPEDAAADVAAALRARAKSHPQSELVEGREARKRLGEDASAALGRPSHSLKIVAITGTNGKTTTARLVREWFSIAGCRAAEMGTLGVTVWSEAGALTEHLETGFTTPDAPVLHDLLAQLKTLGVTHVVMEASSHAMALGRIAGVEIDVAAFTNLTQDHLDFHGTMAAYEAAKARLFSDYLPASGKPKFAVALAANAVGQRMLGAAPNDVQKIAVDLVVESDGINGLEFRFGGGPRLESALVGRFNAENLAIAYAAGAALVPGKADQLASWLKRARPPAGRLQRVDDPLNLRHAFVDYAHTPDALEKALDTLRRAKAPKTRLVVVFGCGGDRDRGKRPLMGEIAARLADDVIITSDNPRTEDPAAIVAEVAKGVPSDKQVRTIVDRANAIREGVRTLGTGDVLVVAGKGHETYQIVGTEKRHFSDSEEIFAAFNAAPL